MPCTTQVRHAWRERECSRPELGRWSSLYPWCHPPIWAPHVPGCMGNRQRIPKGIPAAPGGPGGPPRTGDPVNDGRAGSLGGSRVLDETYSNKAPGADDALDCQGWSVVATRGSPLALARESFRSAAHASLTAFPRLRIEPLAMARHAAVPDGQHQLALLRFRGQRGHRLMPQDAHLVRREHRLQPDSLVGAQPGHLFRRCPCGSPTAPRRQGRASGASGARARLVAPTTSRSCAPRPWACPPAWPGSPGSPTRASRSRSACRS